MYGYRNRYDDEYDPRDDYDCGGGRGGCEGCSCCEEEVTTRKLVVARKARRNILPGDLVAVTSGFTYQKNGGPRTGYYHNENIVGYGPGHGPEKMGKGWPTREGSRTFASVHPEYAEIDNARLAREQAEREAAEAARKAEAERVAAEKWGVQRAKAGEVVTYQGQTWTVGPWQTKTVYHSNLEYYGELCDATCYSVRTLTNTETGVTQTFRP